MAGEWRRTNCVEQHYRVDGKIVGKLHRPHGETRWGMMVYLHSGKVRKVIGFRKDEAIARSRVEAEIAKRLAARLE